MFCQICFISFSLSVCVKCESRSVVSDSLQPLAYSPPGSSVHGILQARIQAWVAIPFSRGSSQLRNQTWVSCIAGRFFTIWTTREAVCLVLSKAIPSESFLQMWWHFTPRESVYNYTTVISLGILDIKPVSRPYLNFTVSLFSSFFIFPDLVFCQGSCIVLSVSLPFSVD